MERVTRQQIANIFYQEGVDKKEVLATIKKELDIEVDPSLDVEAQIDQVYGIYTETMDQLEKETSEKYAPKPKKGKKVKLSRKDYIIELVSKGEHTRDELVELTDEYFDYDEGKTSRSRVSRVLRELDHEGRLAESEEGIFSLVS